MRALAGISTALRRRMVWVPLTLVAVLALAATTISTRDYATLSSAIRRTPRARLAPTHAATSARPTPRP
jgi:hypothetical protein